MGEELPAEKEQHQIAGRLYRVVWRWHFYAGMIIAPVLIVMSATGALYIFKDELEGLIYPGITYVKPTVGRIPFDQQLETARAAVPAPCRITMMQKFSDPRRATSFAMFGKKFQYGYVDPYRGHYLGAIEQGGFFDVVLQLHRQLFLGVIGRVIVELTTCWTIVLVLTGAYLWWPKKKNQLWGVWLPRLRRHPYVILRDLHSVLGIYIGAFAVVIACTGLMYSYIWGAGYQYGSQKTDAFDMFTKPMLSQCPPEAKDISMQRIIEISERKMPGKTLTVWFPRVPNAVYMVFASSDGGPTVSEMLFIDRASGEILEDRYNSQTKLFYFLGTWNYPLHVGSILGFPSKVVWLATCLILMSAPLTGLWMWWLRRPKGKLGLPRRLDHPLPSWLIAIIIPLGICLPALGISVVLLVLMDQVAVRSMKWLRRA